MVQKLKNAQKRMTILRKLSESSFRKFGSKAVDCKFKCSHNCWTQEKTQKAFGQCIVDENMLHAVNTAVLDLFSNEGVSSCIRFFRGHLKYQLHGFSRVFLVLQVYNIASIFLTFNKMVGIYSKGSYIGRNRHILFSLDRKQLSFSSKPSR